MSHLPIHAGRWMQVYLPRVCYLHGCALKSSWLLLLLGINFRPLRFNGSRTKAGHISTPIIGRLAAMNGRFRRSLRVELGQIQAGHSPVGSTTEQHFRIQRGLPCLEVQLPRQEN